MSASGPARRGGWVARAFLLLAAATGGMVVLGYALPARFTLERSVTVRAPREAVRALLERPAAHEAWGAWIARRGTPGRDGRGPRRGARVRRELEGPGAGAGAVLRWHGGTLGAGRVEITESRPGRVAYTLELDAGAWRFEGVWDLSPGPEPGTTRVTWSTEGEARWGPAPRWVALFVEDLLGPERREALESLRALAEGRGPPAPEPGAAEAPGEGTDEG